MMVLAGSMDKIVANIATKASPFVAIMENDGVAISFYGFGMLADWLRKALEHSGISQAELSRQLTERLGRSIDRAAVNKMLIGDDKGKKGRKIAGDEMIAIAEITGYPAPETKLEGGITLSASSAARPTTRALRQVPIVGKVEAGVFREVVEYDDEEPRMIFVEQDPDFPDARVFSLEVVGDSMNAADPPMPSGSFAVCVDFDETGLPIEDGMLVAIERTLDGGLAREWTVKQVEFFEDRTEYHPRSTNPKHKPIVVPHNTDTDDGMTVRVMGLVRSVIQPVRVSHLRK